MSPTACLAATPGPEDINEVNGALPGLSFDEIDRYIGQLDDEIKSVSPDVDFKQLVYKIARNEVSFSPGDIAKKLASYIFMEVVANSALLGKLVLLAIICAVLQNLTAAFEKGSTGQLTYMVTYLVMVALAIGSFTLAVNSGREVVDRMVAFMQVILPVLLTLLVAVGGFTAAAIYQPVVFISIALIATIIKNIVLPLLLFSAVLVLVSNLSSKFKVSNLAGLIKNVAMGILGVMSTIFLGVLSIQGVAGAVGDSVVLRTAKFATDAFVPVVGGMFSDALEAIVSSSLLIKNAVGIAGVVVVLSIMLMPLLKILCIALIYKLAGAMIQPVEEGQVAGCLNDLGNSLLSVFAVVATAGLLFFFTLAIVVAVGNITVMLRS
ncbi:MAG: stage III sporulation protein AE [Peptococcaceae bacterium BICA1-7]|nr:MAG: stage III sporulation protein AE [Peptococcaceae bacterium BICA1-7]HBV96833.1 stage III sporulation protein AE [Desulfotomaculum sp.]